MHRTELSRTWLLPIVVLVGLGSLALADRSTSCSTGASDDDLRPRLVAIPSGTYEMGDAGGDPDERPVHEVRVEAFFMCATEVSVAQYERVTGERPNDPHYGARDVNPVHNVNWYEAASYLNELTMIENRARLATGEPALTPCYDADYAWDESCTGYRLPTEAEWEYAARAGTNTPWFFGNDGGKLCKHGNVNDELAGCEDGFRNLAPVETGSLAANPWRLHGMYGNVWEWTYDWYDANFYSRSEAGEFVNRSATNDRVVRGGSYWAPARVSSSTRASGNPGSVDVSTGFRCARSDRAMVE